MVPIACSSALLRSGLNLQSAKGLCWNNYKSQGLESSRAKKKKKLTGK
jgi:hypothetical protein